MPFKSKAQQKFMFATNPAKAKQWAKETDFSNLPEKKHPSVNPEGRKLEKKADGMFFQKRAQPKEGGRFFRDLPGRGDGTFHDKTANEIMGYGGGMPGIGMPNATPPIGNEMGGGMYGTGEPPKNQKEQKRLLDLLDSAGPGKTRTATKTASSTPADWESEQNLPTGFHRPASEQPEPLESGGDRFLSTQAKPAEAGSPTSVRHGVREGGSMQMAATASPQMGKHASVRFFGTSFAKQANAPSTFSEEGARQRIGEAGNTLQNLGRDIASKADEGIKAVTKSPAAMGVAALLGGKLLLRGGRGVARGTARMFGRKPAPKPGMIAQGIGSLRKLVTGR